MNFCCVSVQMCVCRKDFSKIKSEMFFLLVIIAVQLSGTECVQRFAEVPAYTEVNPGEDALLKCRVADKKGVCSWQKDNKPVGIYKGKYEWANEDSPVGGDCSLWVRTATLQIDDGQWQCQVTASNFEVQDALSSPPAPLAVRVPPQAPRILFNGSQVMPGQNISIQEGSRATIVCEARYGNPPATISWFLEDEQLTAWSSTNSSEVERPRVWAVRSVLELAATRLTHGRQLACRASHPSYPHPGHKEAFTLLDVTYTPIVTISGGEGGLSNLEEASSVVALECKADGNPQPYAWWSRGGQALTTPGPKLILAPVERNHTGIYTCQAKNSVGTSEPARIDIDVKYAPQNVYASPGPIVEASLFTKATLTCKADGNPKPTFQWLHDPIPIGQEASLGPRGYVVGTEPELVLPNVTYRHHGHYICVALNHIAGKERTQSSAPLTLNVLGPPVGAGTGSSSGWVGRAVSMTASVCALPPPRRAAWRWGSLTLNAPDQQGRFRALEPIETNGCYRYTLNIDGAQREDARLYMLNVENERGSTTYSVALTLHETAQLAPLIGAAFVIVTLLIVITCLLRKCRRKKDSVEYKSDDLDTEKCVPIPADATYGISNEIRRPPIMNGNSAPNGIYGTHGPIGHNGTMASNGTIGSSGVMGPTGTMGSVGMNGGHRRGRYSPDALQKALQDVEREAKNSVYAKLKPNVKYDITISKHGQPSTFIRLAKSSGEDDDTSRLSVSKRDILEAIRSSNRSMNKKQRYERNNNLDEIVINNCDTIEKTYKSDRKHFNRHSDTLETRRMTNRSSLRKRHEPVGINGSRRSNSKKAINIFERPKSLQNYHNSDYLEHVFPGAVEI